MLFDALTVLGGIDSQAIQDLVIHLNREHYVTDEDGTCLGSMLIEHWTRDCTVWLAGHGYNGGELKSDAADYSSERGTCYVLYDGSRMDRDEVLSMV